MPNRRLLATIATAATLSIILLVIPVYGDRSEPSQLQTWPSRTPTSGPKPPSDGGQTPGSGDSGQPASPTPPPPASGQEGTAIAVTATASAATQAASSPVPVGTELPESAFVSTAEPCGLPPTALAVEALTVHLGPGDEFGVVGQLRLLAVRPVIGRAANVPWWLVALENGQAGWIPDRAVIIHGHAGAVEVIEAPIISGQSPESLQTWNPTPNPICPTPMPVSADISTADEGGAASGGSTDVAAGAEASAAGEEASGADEGSAGDSAAAAVELSGQPAANPVDGAEATGTQSGRAPADAGPATDEGASLVAGGMEDGGGDLTWLLVVGIVMILGGAVALFLQRIGSRSNPST